MKLLNILHKSLDNLVGYHKNCFCNYVDAIDFYDGEVVSLYVGGKLFVPATNSCYPHVHIPECEDEYCGGCIPIHPEDTADVVRDMHNMDNKIDRFSPEEREIHRDHSIEDMYRSDCRMCGGIGAH